MQTFKFVPPQMEFATSRGRRVVAMQIGSCVILQIHIAAGLQDCATFSSVDEFEQAFTAARQPEPVQIGRWRGVWPFQQFVSAVLHYRAPTPAVRPPIREITPIEIPPEDIVLESGGQFSASRRRDIIEMAIAGEKTYGNLSRWWAAEGRHLGPSRTTVYRWVAEHRHAQAMARRSQMRVLRGGLE